MNDQPHSIARHPLAEFLPADEWAKIRDDVQFCRISWPVGIELRESKDELAGKVIEIAEGKWSS